VRALLRRGGRGREDDSKGEVRLGDMVIYPEKVAVTVEGREINLSLTEFNILLLLARRPGWVFSREQIIAAVRGHNYAVTPRMIDVQVFSLRKKLGAAGGDIETVRGAGYRFRDPQLA